MCDRCSLYMAFYRHHTSLLYISLLCWQTSHSTEWAVKSALQKQLGILPKSLEPDRSDTSLYFVYKHFQRLPMTCGIDHASTNHELTSHLLLPFPLKLYANFYTCDLQLWCLWATTSLCLLLPRNPVWIITVLHRHAKVTSTCYRQRSYYYCTSDEHLTTYLLTHNSGAVTNLMRNCKMWPKANCNYKCEEDKRERTRGLCFHSALSSKGKQRFPLSLNSSG